MVGARNVRHGTHVDMSRSILRRPPTGQKPASLMREEDIFRPWCWPLACMSPSRASPMRLSGTKTGCFRPNVRSARASRPPTFMRLSDGSRNGLFAINSFRFM